MLDLDLSGHRAVVTGASLGIGEATVKMLADHGAAVHFCARKESAIAALAEYSPQHSAGSVSGYSADMGNADSVNGFLEAVSAEGTVDILVNNVGASPSRNFLYMTDEDWTSLHELNLMSAVRCTRHFLPGMRKNKWGRVIMVSSAAARYPNAALIDYAATKSAMVATAKALSKKYAADNVLFNSVLPGLIHTDMWERAATEVAEANNIDKEAVLAGNAKAVPVGRYGRSEEVAAVITFLCSEAASYVNGIAIDVDGGRGVHV